jgi:hypothetical protein
MIVRFRAYCNGELWYATAERADIFAVGGSLSELMDNVDLVTRMHYGGRVAPGEGLHITMTNEVGAGDLGR